MAFSRYFALFGSACSLLPFISGTIRFRNRPLYLKLLCVVAGVSFLSDILSDHYHTRNLVINLYSFFEFISFLLIFFFLFEKKGRRFFTLLGVSGLVLGVVNIIFIQQEHYNTYTKILYSIIFLALSIIFFYRTMRDQTDQKINHMPTFWIVSGALFYSSSSLFLFSIYDFLTADAHPPYTKLLIYWNFHAVFAIGAQILFGISFWQKDSFIHHRAVNAQVL